MDGTRVLASSNYYHTRELHHNPCRAADSTVYKSRQLITTGGVSLVEMLHIRLHTATCFHVLGCDETNPQQQTAAATYRTSRISYLAAGSVSSNER